MALTLVESSKIAMGKDQVLLATVMELYARGSDVTGNLPFDNIGGAAETFLREKTLPNAGFRKINAGYTEGTGETDRITEALAIAGGDLDVDKFLVDTGGGNQRAIQEGMKIKALSLNIAKTVIKGSVITTPESFDGLQVRLTDDQLVNSGTASTSCALHLIKLDELIDAVEDPTHLIMNKTMRRRLTVAARTPAVGGTINYTVDAFGRRVTQYNDLPILIADKDETHTDIMAFNETAGGTGTAVISTSIYCVSFAEDGIVGLQNSPMDVRDLGEIESKPVFRTRIEWYITISMRRPRSAARLRGISNLTVTV